VTYRQRRRRRFYHHDCGGQHTLSGKIADTAAAVHDLAISNVTATLAEDKAYTFLSERHLRLRDQRP